MFGGGEDEDVKEFLWRFEQSVPLYYKGPKLGFAQQDQIRLCSLPYY